MDAFSLVKGKKKTTEEEHRVSSAVTMLAETPPTLGGDSVFDGCPALKQIKVPKGEAALYKAEWSALGALTSLIVD